ncbi:phage tail tape measure protein [Oenococcus sp.]|uniref:phage tail tape measure protein n=1 Tax=Oenococcus sp. TaxID=1979414 RepID=UPI0039EA5D6E
MAGTIKGITIEINGDTTGLDKALKSVNSSVKSAQSELTKLRTDLRFSPDSFVLVSQKADVLGRTVGSLKNKLDTLKAAQSQVEAQFKSGKIGVEQYEAFNRELVETESKLRTYSSQLKTAQSATSGLNGIVLRVKDSMAGVRQSFQDATNRMSKFRQVGASISDVGKRLTSTLTLSVGAGFAYAGKQAIDFDSQMQQVKALLNNGTSESNLSKQIKELGNASKDWAEQYGVSTTSINEGMEEIIKRGYTFQQTLGAMPSILNATKASGDDFNTVMTASTSILEQFGLKANSTNQMLKNTQRVTDSLTFVANKTSAGFSDMAEAMTYIGPTAHAAGVSLEETASAIGLMSNNGIEGTQAGTSMRGVLTAMIKPTKQNAEGFKELGINIGDFKKGTLTLPEMLDKIKNNTQNWTKAQRASAIAMAVGRNAQSGMNVLVAQGGSALDKMTKSTQNATGYTKQLADQLNNTSANNVKKLQQSLQVLAITIGQDLIPYITPLVKNLTNLVKGFSNLSDGTKKFIIIGAAAMAVLGPILIILGSLVQAITIIWPILVAIGTAIGVIVTAIAGFLGMPIIVVILSIVAAITAVVLAILNWKNITNSLKAAWIGLQQFFTNFWVATKAVFSAGWQAVVGIFHSAINGISAFLHSGMGQIALAIANPILGVVNIVRQSWNLIAGTTRSIWNGIKSFTSGAFNSIRSVASSTWNGIKSAIISPISATQSIIASIIARIKSMFKFKLHFPSISIPHVPLPHFSISGSFNPLKGKLPKIGVSWYANGGIFNKPTLFATPNGLAGVGEAGPEAALPLNSKTLASIGQGIVSALGGNMGMNINVNLYPTNDMTDSGINNMAAKFVDAIKSNPFMRKNLSSMVGITLAKGVN